MVGMHVMALDTHVINYSDALKVLPQVHTQAMFTGVRLSTTDICGGTYVIAS